MTAPTVEQPGRSWSVWRIIAVVVVIALVLFWIWVFAGGPAKKNPDYLNDRAWVRRAGTTCSATQRAIAALPGAETTIDNVARAAVVDQASDQIEAMIDHLRHPLPENPGDAKIVTQWLTDYRTYLAARRNYADRLRKDRNAQLLLTEKFKQPIDDVISTFAQVNRLASCEVSGDVA